MPADQKNFAVFTYTTNGAVDYNKRGELDAVRNAVDGSSPLGGNPNFGPESPRHRTRKIIYQDPTTFRTKTVIFYTQAAFDAIVLGTDTLAFHVEGLTTTVAYTAAARIEEKLGSALASRNLADHA